MSHYTCAVILPPGKDLPLRLEELLAPYDENGEMFADGSRWDYWIIGGRWDGEIKGLKWKSHTETCSQCEGTGERPGGREQFGDSWYKANNGCNGCNGTGRAEVWPSDDRYTTPERNLTYMKDISPDYTPTAFVRPTGEWVEQTRKGSWGADIPDEDGKEKADKVDEFNEAWAEAHDIYSDFVVVGVNCHV